VRQRYRYPDESINAIVQRLETLLDGTIQMAQKSGPKRMTTIIYRLRLCLGCARKLQKHFPQRDWSLLRCTNEDELPWFKTEGIPRSYARTNWYKAKREMEIGIDTLDYWEYRHGEGSTADS
jgi:hypothetical protein